MDLVLVGLESVNVEFSISDLAADGVCNDSGAVASEAGNAAEARTWTPACMASNKIDAGSANNLISIATLRKILS